MAFGVRFLHSWAVRDYVEEMTQNKCFRFYYLIKFCEDAFVMLRPLAVTVFIDGTVLASTLTAKVNGLITFPGIKQRASGWWCDNWFFKTCEYYTSLDDLRIDRKWVLVR